MTCVVGLESKGAVWMASDSFLGTDTSKDLTPGPKWFQVSGMTFGWAGDVRAAQVLEHHLKVRPIRKTEVSSRYLVSVVARAVRDNLREAGVVFRNTDGTDTSGLELLIALRGHLYQMWGDCSVMRCSRGVGAIGAGGAYALGALSALMPLPENDSPEKHLMRVMRLTNGLCTSVSGPYYVHEFPNP